MNEVLQVEAQLLSLRAVAVHLGATGAVGHYVAWVRDYRGTGFSVYDDSQTAWYGCAHLPDFVHTCATLASYEPLTSFFSCARISSIASALLACLPEGDSKNFSCISRDSGVIRTLARTPAPPSAAASDFEDEDAPDLDAAWPGEHEADGHLLSLAGDSTELFRNHAQGLLDVFSATGSLQKCEAYLQTLPSTSPEISRLGPRSFLKRLEKTLQDVMLSRTTGVDAVELTIPFWLCHDYRLCVLCEAVSYSSALPSVFFLDSLRCAAASLLNKDLCSRQRCGYPMTGWCQFPVNYERVNIYWAAVYFSFQKTSALHVLALLPVGSPGFPSFFVKHAMP